LVNKISIYISVYNTEYS